MRRSTSRPRENGPGTSRPALPPASPGGAASGYGHLIRASPASAGNFFGGHRLSVIMYIAVPTATWEVSMNFLQDRRVLWGGAVIIV